MARRGQGLHQQRGMQRQKHMGAHREQAIAQRRALPAIRQSHHQQTGGRRHHTDLRQQAAA
jgi:hypothetical protein